MIVINFGVAACLRGAYLKVGAYSAIATIIMISMLKTAEILGYIASKVISKLTNG